ncbi:MAG: Na(+)/H(+) antiporter subunit B [Candidatus Angelobacter sp.]|jgi:energy-converting hydrogenase B subunit D
MAILEIAILIFAGITGTAVVLTRNPLNQVIGLAFYGLIMALMFFIFQAPDVALSQIVIGAVLLPLMVLLTLAKLKSKDQGNKGSTR